MLLVGESIRLSVTITNHSSSPRILKEHLNAQLKDYDSNPNITFWNMCKKVTIQPYEGEKLIPRRYWFTDNVYTICTVSGTVVGFLHLIVMVKANTVEYMFIFTHFFLSVNSFDTPPRHPSLWIRISSGRWWHCEHGGGDKGHKY